jgi:hypothetical protein
VTKTVFPEFEPKSLKSKISIILSLSTNFRINSWTWVHKKRSEFMVSGWTYRNIRETSGDGNGNDLAVLGGDALKAANFAGFLINGMT